ncbi:BnaC05g28680D [Brassica napus]|uniref:BnaC05g28680D protein n=3 Tax=Brassica TaxID=3705 RepID=A0A078H0Q6_BRANA|nr:BnaC05g28680D [Brassica napus]VDD45052.1 unnamed protein product [Brassica oleracea]
MIYTTDSWTLNKILFPKALIGSTRSADTAKIDHDLTSKKLLYAANWTMEQEEDIQLYLHPIWSHISSCRKHLKSLCKLDPDAFSIPMMSSKLIDIAASNEQSKPLSKTLFESLSSVGVLRLTYQQWLAENNYNHTDVSSFIRFLDSLRALEKKILSEIVGSPSFTVLIQLYIEVIEKHSFFWSDLVSSSDECKLFFFWSLIKAIKKLDSSFPEEVHVVLEESKNINNITLHGEPESLYYGHMGAILPCRFLQICTLAQQHNLAIKIRIRWTSERVAGARRWSSSLELVAGARRWSSSPEQPCAVITFSSTPPFATLDEAVDTNHATIGARPKPLEPPKVSHPRSRETHAPPQSVGVTAHSGHAPPSPAAVRRSHRARPPSVRRREATAASPSHLRRRRDVCTGCLCLRSFAGCRDVCTGCHVCGDLRRHRDCLMLELGLHSCSAMN